MSSRSVLYLHAFLAMMCIAAGMSESYSWLAWATLLIGLVLPLLLGNIAMPFVILWLARKERRNPGRIAAAVTLSVVLTVASFFAVFPLCM
jgi:hypothetical protein